MKIHELQWAIFVYKVARMDEVLTTGKASLFGARRGINAPSLKNKSYKKGGMNHAFNRDKD